MGFSFAKCVSQGKRDSDNSENEAVSAASGWQHALPYDYKIL